MKSSSISASTLFREAPIRVPRYRTWHEAIKDSIRDPVELCDLLNLPARYTAGATSAARDFPLFAPRGYVARMRPRDPHDPLLRQILPLEDEQAQPPGFGVDPVGDGAASRSPGLLHKYRSRVLMVTTGACAVHCRYCFRRHFPYDEAPRSLDQWKPALREIAADRTIREVILSGGDPLTLVDAYLAELARGLAAIDHVRQLRIHTRLPVMIPQRVTDELLDWLRGTRLTPHFVIHANHARELDDSVAAALGQLADAGIPLLNQSVLLRGVNDSANAQTELCQRLVELRVMPYYLHQLDRVAGAAHFEVPTDVGRRIVEELRRRLPGYAVPRYVRETSGADHKIILA